MNALAKFRPPATVAATPRASRNLARAVQDGPWLVFVIWTAVGFIVMPLGLGEERLRAWLGEETGGASALAWIFLRASDAVWICLAAVVVYLSTTAAEGLAVARRWAAIILLCAAFFEWVGATTGFPFGPYVYTDRFGIRIAGVLPFTIPLAWLIILLGSRAVVLWLRPAATRLELSLGVALLGLLTDLNLEIIAWKERGYWLWYPDAAATGGTTPPWPPWQNFLSWAVLFFLLTYALPASTGLRINRPRWAMRRPVYVLLLMNTLFLLTHVARLAR